MTFFIAMAGGCGDLLETSQFLVLEGARTLVKFEDNWRCMIPLI